MDARQLEKAAIRLIVDALVSERGFKFRRSAFRVEEPKLTLLAPSSLIESGLPVPLDICVNALTPLYHASILSECSQIDAGIKELILFTRRWAKDRGICHASKGHLSPYYWMLLVIYYLQVRPEQSNASLTPLTDFRSSIDLLGMPAVKQKLGRKGLIRKVMRGFARKASVAELFKEFVHFYATFDWSQEVVDPLTGVRRKVDVDRAKDNGSSSQWQPAGWSLYPESPF
eukprot:TRINITY_DN13663_c0_g1_i3.p1 TRINITY_DN13663_c0_g1~~TRINITY_DN13663_c0_g1_i3.p1  ORF type:complete len:229 (+),score=36.31 TRINITY_DN13663_c0_g1_i3:717-1403(+)